MAMAAATMSETALVLDILNSVRCATQGLVQDAGQEEDERISFFNVGLDFEDLRGCLKKETSFRKNKLLKIDPLTADLL